MAQLVVRNLDEAVKEGLRQRAARNKTSMEEEARDILSAAINIARKPPKKFGTWTASFFKDVGLTEPLQKPPRQLPRPAKFR